MLKESEVLLKQQPENDLIETGSAQDLEEAVSNAL